MLAFFFFLFIYFCRSFGDDKLLCALMLRNCGAQSYASWEQLDILFNFVGHGKRLNAYVLRIRLTFNGRNGLTLVD